MILATCCQVTLPLIFLSKVNEDSPFRGLKAEDVCPLEISQHISAVKNERAVGGNHRAIEGRVVREDHHAVHGLYDFRTEINRVSRLAVEHDGGDIRIRIVDQGPFLMQSPQYLKGR